MTETVVQAESMKKALSQVKALYGPDAYIISSKKVGGKVAVTVSTDKSQKLTPKKKKAEAYFPKVDASEAIIINREQDLEKPITLGDPALSQGVQSSTIESPVLKKEFNKLSDHSFTNPLEAVQMIARLCAHHQIDEDFSTRWIQALKPSLTNSVIKLDTVLPKIMPFNHYFLNQVNEKKPIILIGPPGVGKTSLCIKMAAQLLTQGKKVYVATLDTIKSGGIPQLERYLEPMGLSPIVGEQETLSYINDMQNGTLDGVLLIDTPGLNFYDADDLTLLKKWTKQFPFPASLVLSADLHPHFSVEVCQKAKGFNVRQILASRLDVSKHYGGFLNGAIRSGFSLTCFSDSPHIGEPITPLSPDQLVNRLIKSL